jgi:hypothetical protein
MGHTMTRLFVAVGLVGLAASVIVGAEPTSPPAAPAPAELVARLGSDDFAQRESAVSALERAGAGAIPALRDAAKSPDPEVRHRAAAILTKLQRAADSTGKLAPKKLALDYRDVPIGTAINDLRVRTGLNITLDVNRIANPLRKVTCVTGEVPVWEALEQFCTAAELREVFRAELEIPKVQVTGRRAYTPPPQVPAPDAVPIVLVDGKPRNAPGDRRTAVRVLALPASFPGHRVTLGTGETTLCFDVAPAPGLNWVDVSAVKVTRLIDDAGRPGGAGTAKPMEGGFSDNDNIVVFNGPGGVAMFGGGAMRFDQRGQPIYPDTVPNPRVIPVPLKLATPTARSIKRLEGAVLGEVQLTNQTLLTIADPVKSAGTTFDGLGQVRVTVVGVTEVKNGGTSMQVVLQFPSPWSVGARRGWNPGGFWPEAPRPNQMPSVHAFDAAGKQIFSGNNTSFTDASDDGQTMNYHMTLTFRKDAGTPAKLVVIGARSMVVEVPFVLENVPLP